MIESVYVSLLFVCEHGCVYVLVCENAFIYVVMYVDSGDTLEVSICDRKCVCVSLLSVCERGCVYVLVHS